MARNFAIVYLEQAVSRAAPEERFAQARRSPCECKRRLGLW